MRGLGLSTLRHGLLVVATFWAAEVVDAQTSPRPGTRKPHPPKLSFLENADLKIGVDLMLGGAITYLAPSRRGENVINSFDLGRQIQMSYYSGPVPFSVGDKHPPKHWRHLGWNPIQTGDDYGYPSQVVKHENDGKTLYVQCVPMIWPLPNEPAECLFENWITLEGQAAHVRCKLTMKRSDRTQYPAYSQEMPAVYANAPYHRVMTYTGEKPFTKDALTQIVRGKRNPGDWPWTAFSATESWAALVDKNDWGIGVWNPGCLRFNGGFVGRPGVGGAHDNATGHLAPHRPEILDHHLVHEYSYTLFLGSLTEIRSFVVSRSKKALPSWRFTKDRQGWHFRNAEDAGPPNQGEWKIHAKADDPQLLSPAIFWHATDAPKLKIEAAFHTTESLARVFFETWREAGFPEKHSLPFPIQGDGQFRTYEVDLSRSEHYRGGMLGLRIDPFERKAVNQFVRVREIRLEK